eukprot:TRINITY_DN20109_c0_g1_i1.p1 TRINITY_DN20109_c0_g1~~TRINITY_DN20109_c0_g1_i1.p1  ORF type:complete len:551 (+),score=133.50 TRINITY_DN20109_c0_g1_i1:307-1959(+)
MTSSESSAPAAGTNSEGSIGSNTGSAVAGGGVAVSPSKLFVGGISAHTTTEELRKHFSKYGRIIDAVVMQKNGRPRGFGFVTYESPKPAAKALQETHLIDGRRVDVKQAVPGERAQVAAPQRERGSNKIFVGGLPQDIGTDDLKTYFGNYGAVADAVVMVDRRTSRSRGFGFVRFAGGLQGSAASEAVLLDFSSHHLGGKWIEVKRATPAALLAQAHRATSLVEEESSSGSVASGTGVNACSAGADASSKASGDASSVVTGKCAVTSGGAVGVTCESSSVASTVATTAARAAASASTAPETTSGDIANRAFVSTCDAFAGCPVSNGPPCGSAFSMHHPAPCAACGLACGGSCASCGSWDAYSLALQQQLDEQHAAAAWAACMTFGAHQGVSVEGLPVAGLEAPLPHRSSNARGRRGRRRRRGSSCASVSALGLEEEDDVEDDVAEEDDVGSGEDDSVRFNFSDAAFGGTGLPGRGTIDVATAIPACATASRQLRQSTQGPLAGDGRFRPSSSSSANADTFAGVGGNLPMKESFTREDFLSLEVRPCLSAW